MHGNNLLCLLACAGCIRDNLLIRSLPADLIFIILCGNDGIGDTGMDQGSVKGVAFLERRHLLLRYQIL